MATFLAVIEDPETKLQMCRAIGALATVSDELKFVICSQQVSISAINNAHTSFGEVVFGQDSFRSFRFSPVRAAAGAVGADGAAAGPGSGLGRNAEGAVTYSFLVRSTQLSTLFRKMEDDVEHIRMSFDATRGCRQQDRFRLLLEVTTKSLIRKQFQPVFVPCANDKVGVARSYKELLVRVLEERAAPQDEINYLTVSCGLLKSFVDSSSSVEDFKLEISSSVVSLTCFTTGVFGNERELLKQPMAVNVSFHTDELLNLKLFDASSKKIVFRLREFRTFLALGASSDYIEVWFRRPGDPVLFELTKGGATVQFVQLTDGEQLPGACEGLFVRDEAQDPQEQQQNLQENPQENPQEDPQQDPADYDHGFNFDDASTASRPRRDSSDSAAPTIQWGDQLEHLRLDSFLKSRNDEIGIINEAKSRYLSEIKRRRYRGADGVDSVPADSVPADSLPEGDEDSGLGPTQNITKAKGIFD